METMQRLKSEGRTVIIASHDPIVYGSAFVDEVIEMRDGAIIDAKAAS
jgi:putative ABC transport system ATP-binding protein